MSFANMDVTMRALRNLGTFSTTHMAQNAVQVFNKFAPLNAVDSCAYPEFIAMEQLCGEFLLNLFHAQNPQEYTFFSTSGSSEALFMSLLFMKNYWEQKNQPPKQKPNFVIGTNGHTAWHKAAAYLNVELRCIPVHPHLLNLDETHLFNAIDSNTIGVGTTLGATTTLNYDEIEKINIALNDFRNKKNLFIPMHVDAASGGFVAPFVQKEIQFDFRLNHVMSINVSSHKFGQVYPSLGWLCVKNEISANDLAHETHYLGKPIKRYPIQFSHSASQLATQAYYVESLNKAGYEKLIKTLVEKTAFLVTQFQRFDEIKLITPTRVPSLPGIVFSFQENTEHNLAGLAAHLATQGWHLPTFRLPQPLQETLVSRIVVKNGFDEAMMQALIKVMGNYFVSTPE